MNLTEFSGIILGAIGLLVSLCVSYVFITVRRKLDLKLASLEERNEMLMRDSIRYRVNDYEHRSNINKGFSDDLADIHMITKELRNFRLEMRREWNSNASVTTDFITNQVTNAIQQSVFSQVQPEIISKQILAEIATQMSFDHFYELKVHHYNSKIHDTSRTLLNVLHVLRTPLSGIRINVQALNRLNVAYDPELQNKYAQIEDAINLIESSMRTLGAYEDKNDDTFDLKERIRKNMNLLLLSANKKINLNTSEVPEGYVFSSEVIDNILLCIACVVENAIAYSQDNSEIIIKATSKDDEYKVSIINFGSNIPDEISAKIFDDGFSSREGGYGIGLNLASTIMAERLNGSISFENLVDPYGVIFHLIFEVVQ